VSDIVHKTEYIAIDTLWCCLDVYYI